MDFWDGYSTQLAIDFDDNLYFYGVTQTGANLSNPQPLEVNSLYYNQPNHGNFLTTSGSNYYDCFVAKFNQSNAIDWSTHYGGNGKEILSGIEISNDKVFISGTTVSVGDIAFPTTNTIPLFCPEEFVPNEEPYCQMGSLSTSNAYIAQLFKGNTITSVLDETHKNIASDILINVYPNPTVGIFKVDINMINPNSQNFTLTVYNLIGEQIFTNKYSATGNYATQIIDLSNKARGVYAVVVQSDDFIVTKKIVKQ